MTSQLAVSCRKRPFFDTLLSLLEATISWKWQSKVCHWITKPNALWKFKKIITFLKSTAVTFFHLQIKFKDFFWNSTKYSTPFFENLKGCMIFFSRRFINSMPKTRLVFFWVDYKMILGWVLLGQQKWYHHILTLLLQSHTK